MNNQQIERFRERINSYYKISDSSFDKILSITFLQLIDKNKLFLEQGSIGRYFCFLDTGYMISYTHDTEGKTYSKNIFSAGDWVGSTVSSILQKPSNFTIRALTDCSILCIPYLKLRDLIFTIDDLKTFYIKYLEKNWVIDKEEREVSLVMDSAQIRYNNLLHQYIDIEKYVSLKDIASHLGITPTQLSRIRKNKKL